MMSDSIKTFTGAEFFRPGESVYIHMSKCYPQFVGVLHKHSFIEIVYVLSGEAVHVVGDRSYPVKKGAVLLINYDTPHMFRAKDAEFSAYDLMFTPDFFDASAISGGSFETLSSSFLFYSLFPNEQPLGSDLELSSATGAEFAELFDKIYKEYTRCEKGYTELIRAYVIALIIKLFRCIDRDPRTALSDKQAQIVDAAVAYLRENFDSPVSMGDLAARVFLSKDYFGHLFKDATGMSVSAFLQKLRIDEACRLLVTTDRKINDIAVTCGFGDLKFFYACFKRAVGTTPASYRKTNK